MKKILSLTLVVLMLLCIVPMTVSAGDTLIPDLPGFHTRYAEFHIVQHGGYYNANSGAAITNGGFYTAANGLNIPNGYTGNIVIYVYHATNEPADAVLNHYVGVVYTEAGKSDSFYPLGDLMAVIYRSMENSGKELASLKWSAFGLDFTDTTLLNTPIVAAVFATPGTLYAWEAVWGNAACVDHSFGTDNVCDVCGHIMQTTYVVGDYTYVVVGADNMPINIHGLGVNGGWAVYATDKTKSSYGEIRETLHGFPVTFMYKTFDGCSNMTVAPAIPAHVQVAYNAYKGSGITSTPDMGNVVKLYGAFKNCKNLTNVGTIPATVTDMTGAFSGCTALTTAPAIPASVVNMTQAFKGCTKLTSAPDVTGVANITEAFDGCTAMKGNVAFDANLNAKAFRNTKITSATVGASTIQKSCFYNSQLKTVNYDGTLAQWLGVTVEAYNGKVKTSNVKVSDDTAAVTVKNGVTYISGLENAKDFFIGKGTCNTYRQVKNALKYSATSAKFANTNVYTYAGVFAKGDYTLCVRYNDGTSKIVNFTVA